MLKLFDQQQCRLMMKILVSRIFLVELEFLKLQDRYLGLTLQDFQAIDYCQIV